MRLMPAEGVPPAGGAADADGIRRHLPAFDAPELDAGGGVHVALDQD